MNWICKLGHPFECGLYIDKTNDIWHLRCKRCDFDYTGVRLGKNE